MAKPNSEKKELEEKIGYLEEQIRVAKKHPTYNAQFYNALGRDRKELAMLKQELRG